jgi:hypothetical protein
VFTLPTFNLVCDIHTGIGGAFPPLAVSTAGVRVPNVPCALAHGRLSSRVAQTGSGFNTIPVTVMQLLLPKLTDIRGFECNTTVPDQVECPKGSGRWYWVPSVDDVGKGYANEYRLAVLQAIVETWAPPYP